MGRAADIRLAELLGWVDFHEALGIWYAIPPENLASPQFPSGIPLKVRLPCWSTNIEDMEDLVERTIKVIVEFNPVFGRTPMALFDLVRYGMGRYGARFRWHSDVPMSTGGTIVGVVSWAAMDALEGIAKAVSAR